MSEVISANVHFALIQGISYLELKVGNSLLQTLIVAQHGLYLISLVPELNLQSILYLGVELYKNLFTTNSSEKLFVRCGQTFNK